MFFRTWSTWRVPGFLLFLLRPESGRLVLLHVRETRRCARIPRATKTAMDETCTSTRNDPEVNSNVNARTDTARNQNGMNRCGGCPFGSPGGWRHGGEPWEMGGKGGGGEGGKGGDAGTGPERRAWSVARDAWTACGGSRPARTAMNRAFKTPGWTPVAGVCWHRAGVPSQPLGRCTRQLGESLNARARTGRCRTCGCPLPPLSQAHILPRNVVSTRKIFRIGSPPSRGRDPNRPVSPAPLSCPFHPRSPPSEPEDPSTREERGSASNAPLFAFPAKKGEPGWEP